MASQTRVKCNTDSMSVLLCWITLSRVLKEEAAAHVAFRAPAEIASILGPLGPSNGPLVSVVRHARSIKGLWHNPVNWQKEVK